MMESFDLIDAIAKKGERIVTRTVGEAGLTPAQYLVLANLPEKEGKPLGELADVLRCSPSTVTGIVDTMEKKELVAREPNPEDRRSHLLALTAKGRTLRRSTSGLDRFYEGCTVGMSRQEFERLRDMLLRLDACLSTAGVV
jgi:DNA-binding MarR family transcriptional regulator